MTNKKVPVLLLCLLSLLFCPGCDQNPQPETRQSGLPVIVSIEPQAFFVNQIGGDRVQVEVLVPPGKEPETYIPNPEKIKQFAKSRLFFRTGFPSEETFLPKLQTVAPNLTVVDTRKGIPLKKLTAHSHFDMSVDEHNHDESDCSELDHGESGSDPHIWLSPTLVKQQAATIFEALCDQNPAGRSEYEVHLNRFLEQLEETRVKVAEILREHQGEVIYVFHPAYGYFCDEFGLQQRAIEVEGKSPKPRELAAWISQAKKDNARKILIQPEFNPALAEQIAQQVGAKVVVHSSLGRNYFHDLIELAELIVE